jgi:hypothetical protein
MAKIDLQSASTTLTDAAQAADQVLAGIHLARTKIVFGFLPGDRDQRALHQALRERLPKSIRLVTMSTVAGITNEGYLPGAVTLGALGGDLDIGIGYGTGLAGSAPEIGAKMVEKAASELGVSVGDLDRRSGGIVLDDGSKMKKEELLLGALEHNQGLVLVGGGAVSDVMGAPGVLGVDGELFSDGALTVLFRTSAPWAAMRHHAFEMLGKRVRVTKVDVANHRILELDGMPAGKRWSELVEAPAEHLTYARPDQLLRHGFALKVGREYFMRSIYKDAESDDLIAANWQQEGQELELARMGDPPAALDKFLTHDLPGRVFSPTGVLFFDCGARRFLAQLSDTEKALGASFQKAPPCAGGVVWFETYCGFMVNGTLTSLAFGSDG